MAYTFPPDGTKLQPVFNDLPPNYTPTNQEYDNYLLQRYWQGLAWSQNAQAAAFYVSRDPNSMGTFYNWLWWQYNTGSVPFDANPPAPPNQQWVLVTRPTEFSANFQLVEMPGMPVCGVPWFARIPPPQH